jgi:hypothetical protein
MVGVGRDDVALTGGTWCCAVIALWQERIRAVIYSKSTIK